MTHPRDEPKNPPKPRYTVRRMRSFGFALAGLKHLIATQPNARIHALATLAVLSLAIWLAPSLDGWLLLCVAIFVVWMAEAFNTAVEAVVDLASPGPHALAKIAKDAAAAGVLLAALLAGVIGVLVLGPLLWRTL